MENLSLPTGFEAVLSTNKKYHGATKTLLNKFEEWLYQNRLTFFPEYTDHGVNHVSAVLHTAWRILPVEATSLMTPEDIYVLTSAILLHDCAMHLDKTGLRELLENEYYSSPLFGFNFENSFREEWDSFKSEVSKYTEKDWAKFTAESHPIAFPSLTKELSENQFLLIGEYIRKHHARIAQVIASHGLPTDAGPYQLFDNQLMPLNDLAGFAARSHNLSLREAIDILGQTNARFTKNVHLSFLMGVLRIADYLQFENNRTPKLCFKTRAFCSPISLQEWKKHLSIINTHQMHDDQELLFVDASPDDAQTLQNITELLAGLQHELDCFWAVMGESYSRFGERKNLGIKLRRVRSTIDDAIEYVQRHHKQFHPKLLGLRTNDERLYPLLISPLYGDRPLVGLRELLQNAVDACNERFAAEQQRDPLNLSVPYTVEVKLDPRQPLLVISDEGMGMDVEIISDYFLRIGSSYRYSQNWQNTFNEKNGTTVPRTGRFGIGVLAGFLLGDKITVHTRRADQPAEKSLRFSLTPSSQSIEVQYIPKEKPGTSIEINLSQKAANELITHSKHEITSRSTRYNDPQRADEWRWYYFNTPLISFYIDEGEGVTKPLHNNYLINKNNLDDEWIEVISTTPASCYWRPAETDNTFCNGITLTLQTPEIKIPGTLATMHSFRYEVLYIDKNADLPINLRRDGFTTGELFLRDEIKRSMLSTEAWHIINEIGSHVRRRGKIDRSLEIRPAIFYHQYFPLVIDGETAFPLHPGFRVPTNKLTIIDFEKASLRRGLKHSERLGVLLDQFCYTAIFDVEKQSDSLRSAFLLFTDLSRDRSRYGFYKQMKNFEVSTNSLSGWLFIKEYDFAKLDSQDHTFLAKTGFKISKINKDWIVISRTHEPSDIPSQLKAEIDKNTDLNCFMFGLAYLPDTSCQGSIFAEEWTALGLPEILRNDTVSHFGED